MQTWCCLQNTSSIAAPPRKVALQPPLSPPNRFALGFDPGKVILADVSITFPGLVSSGPRPHTRTLQSRLGCSDSPRLPSRCRAWVGELQNCNVHHNALNCNVDRTQFWKCGPRTLLTPGTPTIDHPAPPPARLWSGLHSVFPVCSWVPSLVPASSPHLTGFQLRPVLPLPSSTLWKRPHLEALSSALRPALISASQYNFKGLSVPLDLRVSPSWLKAIVRRKPIYIQTSASTSKLYLKPSHDDVFIVLQPPVYMHVSQTRIKERVSIRCFKSKKEGKLSAISIMVVRTGF